MSKYGVAYILLCHCHASIEWEKNDSFWLLRSHFSMTVKIFQVTVIEASQSCLFCYEEHTLKEIIGSDDKYIVLYYLHLILW